MPGNRCVFKKSILLVMVLVLACIAGLAAAEEERVQYWTTSVYYWSDETEGITFLPDAPVYHEGEYYYADLPDGTVAILGYTGSKRVADMREAIPGKTVSAVSGAGFTDGLWLSPDKPIGGGKGPALHMPKTIIIPETVRCLYCTYGLFGSVGSDLKPAFNELVFLGNPEYCSDIGFNSSFKSFPLLPESLQKNGFGFFTLNTDSRIVLPEGYTYIPGGILQVSKASGELAIPYGVKEIGPGAFYNPNYSTVKIPATVEFIADDAFKKYSENGTDIPRATFEVIAGSYGEFWVTRKGYKSKLIVPASGINLNETAVTTGRGAKALLLKPEVLPAEATNKKTEWVSTDPNVATVKNGSVKGVGIGECDIVCKAADGNGAQAVCHVTVIEWVKSIKFKTGKVKLAAGETTVPEYTILPEDAAVKQLKWSSSDESVCTVGEDGTITAVSAGKCKITCESTDGSEKTAAFNVEVQ